MPDFIEAGSVGPLVMLMHSSVSGAKMWRRLMDALKDRYRVRAVNLIGYGGTPPWREERPQSLDDQARVVEAALPEDADEVYLVGHSFGGAVAMKTAARLGARVTKLALLEANPCYLLQRAGRHEAFGASANAPAPSSGLAPCRISPVPFSDAERRSPAGRPRTARIALG